MNRLSAKPRAACLAASLLLLAAAPAFANPQLHRLRVDVEAARALLSCELTGAFDEDTRERIQSGLPTGFTFEFELRKDRQRWWDQSLASATLQVVTMFNAVTREYLVNYKLDGQLIESRQVHELAELERAMTRIAAMPVFSLDKLPHDWRLLVSGRAEVGARTFVGFIPYRITTNWVDSRKFRVAAE